MLTISSVDQMFWSFLIIFGLLIEGVKATPASYNELRTFIPLTAQENVLFAEELVLSDTTPETENELLSALIQLPEHKKWDLRIVQGWLKHLRQDDMLIMRAKAKLIADIEDMKTSYICGLSFNNMPPINQPVEDLVALEMSIFHFYVLKPFTVANLYRLLKHLDQFSSRKWEANLIPEYMNAIRQAHEKKFPNPATRSAYPLNSFIQTFQTPPFTWSIASSCPRPFSLGSNSSNYNGNLPSSSNPTTANLPESIYPRLIQSNNRNANSSGSEALNQARLELLAKYDPLQLSPISRKNEAFETYWASLMSGQGFQ